MRRVRFRILLLYIFLGALIGSYIGEIAQLFPDGVVKDFFLKSVGAGFDPTTLDLEVFNITLGFSFSLNIAGLIGIAVAVYMLRWYR
ncbi:DUF4321 domain-containing protein [candidate division KSB1 bacterium]